MKGPKQKGAFSLENLKIGFFHSRGQSPVFFVVVALERLQPLEKRMPHTGIVLLYNSIQARVVLKTGVLAIFPRIFAFFAL